MFLNLGLLERDVLTGEPENFYCSELFFLYTRKTKDLDSFQPNCIYIFPQQTGFIFWVFYTDNIVHIILLIAYSILLISIWEESAGMVATVWYHWRTRVPYQCCKRGELVSYLYSVLSSLSLTPQPAAAASVSPDLVL